MKALIVDDDNSFIKVVKLCLLSWRSDLQIQVARTISEARQLLASAEPPYELIVLDHHLPDGLGSELFDDQSLSHAVVIAVSADETPELPGSVIKAGASHFLEKALVTDRLFIPLVEALLERAALNRALIASEVKESQLKTIRMLIATLRHEINNPLGAVLGSTYLIKTRGQLRDDQREALRLIEESSYRINHVLERLADAIDVEAVVKGQQEVFQIPGDISWDDRTRQARERAAKRGGG